MTNVTATAANQPSGLAPSRITWVYRAVRIMAAIWGAWILVRLFMLLWNREAFLEGVGKAYGLALIDVPDSRFYPAFAMAAVVFVGAAILSWVIWRLFTLFLEGRALTVEAAQRMRMVAVVGFVVTLLDIGYRPVFFAFLSTDLLAKVPWGSYFRSDDLLHLLLAAMVFAISITYQAAIERAQLVTRKP